MYSRDDTIVAIATPPGHGGIGVVRLSGPEAHRIALDILRRRRPLTPRRATLGRARGAAGTIDAVVAVYFVAPASYTGEDVVELSGHGSPVVLEAIVCLAADAGARLAEPGEFTLRAFLNGRLDLVQAEAVADLIEAVTPLQARAACDQLEGTLTEAIGAAHASLFDVAARLEASLDFPDEGYHFLDGASVAATLREVRDALARLAGSGREGGLVREGRQVAILGQPNTGKSSIFNALTGSSRAIVASLPGTTRDLLTERVDVGGYPLTLIDTAGMREATDEVEREGVARARGAAAVADLVLLVLDTSRTLTNDDRALLGELSQRRTVVAMNKSDLPPAWAGQELAADQVPVVRVSAKTGEGLPELKTALIGALGGGRSVYRDSPFVTNVRHVRLLEAACAVLDRAADAASGGLGEEFVLADLHGARAMLEEITGRRTPEDVLAHIFSRFCIGK